MRRIPAVSIVILSLAIAGCNDKPPTTTPQTQATEVSIEPIIQDWPTKVFPALDGAAIDIKTRLDPGNSNRMHYAVKISPASEIVRKNFDQGRETWTVPRIQIEFQDVAGFTMCRISTNLSFMSPVKNDSGSVVAYELRGQIDCNESRYRAFKDWKGEIEGLVK